MIGRIVGILLAVVFLGGGAALMFLSTPTALEFQQPVKAIGHATPVQVKATNPHGLVSFRIFIEQENARYEAFREDQPHTRFGFFGRNEPPKVFNVRVGKQQAPSLKSGKARLVVEAVSNDFRARTATLAADVTVRLEPPRVTVHEGQHYITQGGAEMATFTAGGDWSEAGVRLGKNTFRSFPIPGRGDPNERVALFAWSWDEPVSAEPVVYARNETGAEATARFWFRVKPKAFRKRELELSDAFLEKVTRDIDPQGQGSLIDRYLRINREMRQQNNKTLADLRNSTADHFLWTQPFVQLGNSKVESQFADQRTYVYQGKHVDQQMHLGFDLSVTKNVAVLAANDGKVVYADRLGIYGNCVVIDHGLGLQSIYGHLSSIGVKQGDMVKRLQEVGKSGATGLAGGDHLHFSMQVDGAQVNPIEWWDGHWIQDRIQKQFAPR